MAEPAKFNHEELIKALQEVNNTIPSINADAFCLTMLEYVKIFDSMGSGLQMAFKDITQKVGRIRRNYATMSHVTGGIMDFIKWEQSEKIHVLNGENPKMAPDPKYAEYESTARTVLRLMWFLDFVSSLVGQLESNRKISVSDACKKAYDTALGPHHPFAIRMAAKTAMTFAPNRHKLLGGLFPKEYTEDEIYAVIRKMMDLVEPIRLFLWGYFEKNDMVKLP